MTDVLLNSLVPIFAVMALGYLAGWIRDIDNHHVGELTALVMDFALPASLFVATASTSRAFLLAQWPLLLVLIVSMLTLYALCYWMQRRLFCLGSSEASVQTITIAQPNYGGAGLALTPCSQLRRWRAARGRLRFLPGSCRARRLHLRPRGRRQLPATRG
jgi:malonate transporter